MHRRETIPLVLMYSEGQEAVQGRTRLQKMAFLLQQELEDIDISTYDFEAYDYGPFSKELYDDLDELIEKELIEESREEFDEDKVLYEYELTDDGEELVEEFIRKQALDDILEQSQMLKKEFNHMDLGEVIDLVYSEYPEYAENSVLR